MIYICIICTGRKPSLLILSDEHRQMLESIVSPTLNLAKLNGFPLWICESCKCLIGSVVTFKNIALVGASHLLTRLDLVQKEEDEHEQPADLLLPVEQDLDDLLQVKSFVEFQLEEKKLKPQELEGDVKTECYDADENHSEPATAANSMKCPCQASLPAVLETPTLKPQELEGDVKTECYDADENHSEPATAANSMKCPCQASLPAVLETPTMEPAVHKPAVCLPTLVLHPLVVTTGAAPRKRRTDNLQLPTVQKKTVKVPTLTLHPLTVGGSTVDNNAEENDKGKEKLCDDQKTSSLYLCRICGQRVPLWQKNRHVAYHAPMYCCHGCRYRTSDRASMVAHRCDSEKPDVNSQGSEALAKKRRVRIRRSPGPVRCDECYARFVDETGLAKHIERLHKEETQKLYVCELCKKEFKTKYKLKYHLARHRKKESQSVDTIKPELFCAECGIQFQAKSSFRTHMASLKHLPRDKWKFKCDSCEKIFANKYALKSHVNFVHRDKLQHQCSQCHKPFPRRYLLQKHVESVHEGKAKPRPYVCHVCGSAFTAKTTLKGHLTTHSDVRPHACPLCPATFKFKAALFTHNRLKHLKIKGNWKKPAKGKEKKKKKKVDAESLDSSVELQIGS